MIIRVEPKDFFMSTILLLFDQARPDPEDEEVKPRNTPKTRKDEERSIWSDFFLRFCIPHSLLRSVSSVRSVVSLTQITVPSGMIAPRGTTTMPSRTW